jgi:hypothetical protein
MSIEKEQKFAMKQKELGKPIYIGDDEVWMPRSKHKMHFNRQYVHHIENDCISCIKHLTGIIPKDLQCQIICKQIQNENNKERRGRISR